MLQNFASDHPVFRCTSALERGEVRSKGGGKTSIHFNGSTQKHWVASPDGRLRQSAQSLRSSAGYDWRITSWSEISRKPAASGQLNKQEILTQPPLAEVQANEERQGNKLVARIRATIWEIIRRPEVIQTVLRSRFEMSWSWTIFLCSSVTFMPRIYVASRSRRNSYKRMHRKQCTILPSLGHESLQSIRKTQYWSSSSIFVSGSNRILD